MNARSLAGITLAASLLAFGTSCTSQAKKQKSPPPVVARTTTVQRRTIATYESLDGQVDPFLQANLAPQQSGTLVEIHANEGDHVRKGEVLAKIDDTLLRANLTQQQGLHIQSTAKLAQSNIQLPITSTSNEQALVQALQALAEAKKTRVADAANVVNTKLTYQADQELLKQGYVSQSVYEQARATYVAAQQTLASDDDKVGQNEAAVREARQNLANTPLQKQVIAENQGAVVQAAGGVNQYKAAVEQTTIVAPFDGVVTARSLDPGSYASPSQAIYAISQLDPVYVDFNVKDDDLAFVIPGTLVSFSTSANPTRRYAGRVASVDAVPATGTLLYRARIIERNPDFSLRGGLQTSVHITKEIHRDALTVPRAAVIQDGANGTIYAAQKNDGKLLAKRMNVKLGLQTSDYVEISGAGVQAGMPIVLDQSDNLHDGVAIATPAASSKP